MSEQSLAAQAGKLFVKLEAAYYQRARAATLERLQLPAQEILKIVEELANVDTPAGIVATDLLKQIQQQIATIIQLANNDELIKKTLEPVEPAVLDELVERSHIELSKIYHDAANYFNILQQAHKLYQEQQQDITKDFTLLRTNITEKLSACIDSQLKLAELNLANAKKELSRIPEEEREQYLSVEIFHHEAFSRQLTELFWDANIKLSERSSKYSNTDEFSSLANNFLGQTYTLNPSDAAKPINLVDKLNSDKLIAQLSVNINQGKSLSGIFIKVFTNLAKKLSKEYEDKLEDNKTAILATVNDTVTAQQRQLEQQLTEIYSYLFGYLDYTKQESSLQQIIAISSSRKHNEPYRLADILLNK